MKLRVLNRFKHKFIVKIFKNNIGNIKLHALTLITIPGLEGFRTYFIYTHQADLVSCNKFG